MVMDPKKFKENLLLYGPDLNKWPEEEKQAGADLLRHSPELQSLFAEQEEFERILKTRKYEEPSSNLAQRIVCLSDPQNIKAPSRLGLFFSGLFADNFYLPNPAFIVVSIFMVTALMTGFFIGFSNPTGSTSTDQGQANLQAFLHYEGDVLWAKE
jgi:hypothetical protein